MPAIPTRSAVRLLGPLVAGALLLPLAGCGSSAGVDCSGGTCTATLTGAGAKAGVLGQDLALVGTTNGTATLSVGDRTVSCTEGDEVSAGPLTLTCATVTDDSVELSASLG